MRTNTIVSLALLAGLSLSLNSQELPLLTDKQGTFQILSRTDYVGYDCGYTKAEVTANLQRITDLVTLSGKILSSRTLKVSTAGQEYIISTASMSSGYGIPSRISFEFASWYRLKDGTPARGSD